MTTKELYKPHIQKGGIRILCEELLEDGVVDPQRLLDWLEAKTRIKPDKETWWIQDKNS